MKGFLHFGILRVKKRVKTGSVRKAETEKAEVTKGRNHKAEKLKKPKNKAEYLKNKCQIFIKIQKAE